MPLRLPLTESTPNLDTLELRKKKQSILLLSRFIDFTLRTFCKTLPHLSNK